MHEKCCNITENIESLQTSGFILDGGRGSVVRASELKSKAPGFYPLAGQGHPQFFCPSESTLMQPCLCLIPLRVYDTHSNVCAR